MSSYWQKLRDPRWQKRRLEIMQRDRWQCCKCYAEGKTLNVHHRWYQGEPWDAPDTALVTLCEDCHTKETKAKEFIEKELASTLRRKFFYSDLVNFVDFVARLRDDCDWSTFSEAEIAGLAGGFNSMMGYTEYASCVDGLLKCYAHQVTGGAHG